VERASARASAAGAFIAPQRCVARARWGSRVPDVYLWLKKYFIIIMRKGDTRRASRQTPALSSSSPSLSSSSRGKGAGANERARAVQLHKEEPVAFLCPSYTPPRLSRPLLVAERR